MGALVEFLGDLLESVFEVVAENPRKTARFLACGLVALGCFVALGVPKLEVQWQFRLGYLLLAAGIALTVETAWPTAERRHRPVAG